MASSAKDIQLRELKDTISQLNTIMSVNAPYPVPFLSFEKLR